MMDVALSSPPPPRVRPLLLPRLSRAAMDRLNQVAAATGAIDAPFGSLALRITVLPSDAKVACDWGLEFQAGSEPVLFHCPHPLLVRLLKAHEPALAPEAAPPGLLALLVDTLLQPALPAWQRALGMPVRFTRLRASQAPPGDALRLQFGAAGETWRGAMSAGALADRLLAHWPAQPHTLSRLPLPGRLRVGTTDLPAAVAASLRPGDAVIIQARPRGGTALRLAERWTAPVRQDGGATLLAEPLRLMRPSDGDTMATTNRVDPGPGDAESLEAVPVRLSFDVGQLEVPLGEVRRLQAGSILPLSRGVAELVEISANGRRIGAGELVDVDGAPAVRIVRLFGVD